MPSLLAPAVALLLALTGPAAVAPAPTTAVPTATAAPTATVAARPRTYHLDCSARTDGTGSVRRPWNTLSAPDGHVFVPGDRLLLKRGTTCTGTLRPQGSGSARHPITVGAYGKGKSLPTVRGGGTGSWTGAVQLTDQQHWTISDLHVTNTDGKAVTDAYRSGVMVQNTLGGVLSGITIERLKVDSVVSSMNSVRVGPRSFGGISVITQGSLHGGFADLDVRQNTVSRVGRTGIVVSNNSYPVGADRTVRITGNRVDHVRGDGIILLGSRGGRVDHNVSAYAAQEWPCPDCGPITRFTASAAIWTGSSDRVRIDHNEAYGTKWLGGDGEGFDVDSFATNTLVEYNYAHDNEGGGILFCGSKGAVARFNIFQNNAKSAFAFIGSAPSQDTVIMNNTVYSARTPRARPVRVFNGSFPTRITFVNNLVYDHSLSGWAWPAKPRTASDTLVGRLGTGRPHGGATSERDPGLKRAGSGKIGFASLAGYRPRHPASFLTGSPIPNGITHDFFGKRLDPRRPPRGASGVRLRRRDTPRRAPATPSPSTQT